MAHWREHMLNIYENWVSALQNLHKILGVQEIPPVCHPSSKKWRQGVPEASWLARLLKILSSRFSEVLPQLKVDQMSVSGLHPTVPAHIHVHIFTYLPHLYTHKKNTSNSFKCIFSGYCTLNLWAIYTTCLLLFDKLLYSLLVKNRIVYHYHCFCGSRI